MIQGIQFTPGPDARAIESSVQQRGIPCIWHLTRLEQLPNVFRARGLLSRHEMDVRGIQYGMSGWGSTDKEEEMRDYIWCSIVSPWGMARNESETKALIPLHQRLLWREGTLFCGKWGSYADVSLAQLLNNSTVREFDLMFQNKYTNFPTPVSGEVLLPHGIPLGEFLQCIYLFNDAARGEALANCGQIVLPSGDVVEKRFKFMAAPGRFGRGT